MNKKKLKRKQYKNQQKKYWPIDKYLLLVSLILILPLVFITKVIDPNLAPRLFGLGGVVLLLLIINVLSPKKNAGQFNFIKLYIFPVFLVYLIWSAITMIYAINPSEGLFDVTKILFSGLLLLFATQIFIKYENALDILVKLVIISSIIATSIGVFQYFENVPGNTGYDLFMALYDVKGLMAHKNQYASSLFLMIPFVFYGVFTFKRWWQWISIYSVLMLLLTIVILQTRSVWVATVVFVFSFVFLWLIFTLKNRKEKISGLFKKGMAIAVIFVVVLLGSLFVLSKTGTLKLMQDKVSSIFDFNDHNNQGRLKIWEATWNLSKDNLVLGVGAGNWKINVLTYYNRNFGASYQNWRRPHNDFLWVLSEKGIIGLILYIALFVMIGIYSIKIIFNESDTKKVAITALLSSGIVGYLIISMVTFPMERINHQVYLMIMMATIISIYYKPSDDVRPIPVKIYQRVFSVLIIITAVAVYYSGLLIRSEFYVRETINARMGKNWEKMRISADEAITKVTTVDPYSMPIHLHRGVANVRLKKTKQAFDDFSTALEYFPTSIAVLNNLAITSAEANDNEKAIYYFRRSLSIFPNYSTSSLNLVKAYYRVQDYTNAYIALLNCDSKNTVKKEYDDFMKELSFRMNLPENNSLPNGNQNVP